MSPWWETTFLGRFLFFSAFLLFFFFFQIFTHYACRRIRFSRNQKKRLNLVWGLLPFCLLCVSVRKTHSTSAHCFWVENSNKQEAESFGMRLNPNTLVDAGGLVKRLLENSCFYLFICLFSAFFTQRSRSFTRSWTESNTINTFSGPSVSRWGSKCFRKKRHKDCRWVHQICFCFCVKKPRNDTQISSLRCFFVFFYLSSV